MDEDESDIEGVVKASEKAWAVPKEDEALVRYVATLLVKGKSEAEIRRTLNENSLSSSLRSPEKWRRLMRLASQTADEIRWMVVAKAEMEDVEQQRIDSYARRKRTMARLEAVIESAHGMADSVSKLNQVSFMAAGLIKAQESMDKFTGAQEAAPQVVVNLGYDPLTQMREVIQQEVIDADVTVVERDVPSSEPRADVEPMSSRREPTRAYDGPDEFEVGDEEE